MDSLRSIHYVVAVDPAEFAELALLSPTTLAEQLETVKEELAEFEAWLADPPAAAGEDNIQAKLSLWDTCRQWLFAYEAELENKQREIAALDEELAEVRGLLRDLENDKHRSHDEMAAADAYWDELDQRENRILRRLDELGARIPDTVQDELGAAPAPTSSIQRALDAEWASANFAGPGCPFCDALFSCGCWARRREALEAEERRRVRESRAEVAARIARGECACDALSQDSQCPSLCEVCQQEEDLRCTGCGQLQCRPDCCGDCGGCSNCRGDACKRCGDWDCSCYEDQQDCESCGCGACEEHDGREDGYDF